MTPRVAHVARTRFVFTAELWEHDGDGAWHFVSLPEEHADEIEAQAPPGPGFGSVPVKVTIGDTAWSTSVFPDRARRTYVLPVKKAVRRSEGLEAGDRVRIELVLATEL